jgi:hypothetical protein
MAAMEKRPGVLGAIPVHRRRESYAEHRWHLMDVNRYPHEQDVFDGDLTALIRDYIIPGHIPAEPLLGADDQVVTVGSCFARELRTYLTEGGFASGNFWVPEGLNNTYAILDFVSWVVTGEETAGGFRYDRLESGEIAEWKPEQERAEYEDAVANAGAFVFTFGLAEVWEDKETGGVFWRGVPESIFDSDRHIFRLTSVEENEANILRTIELVRTINKTAPIVLTLSPVPLGATFRGISCMTADAVSKSTLRVALDRVMSTEPAGVFYWPSFEVVRWAGSHLNWRAYGIPDNKPHHVSRYLVAKIIDAFVEAFYTPAALAQVRAARPQKIERAPSGLQGYAQRLDYLRKVAQRKALSQSELARATRKLQLRLLGR